MKRIIGILCFLVSVLCFSTKVYAADNCTVTFTPNNYNRGYALQEYLDWQQGKTPKYNNLNIVLSPGVYYFDAHLCVYSNTTITATGATIYYTRTAGNGDGCNPIIYNDAAGAYGYNGASNITVDGGIWDLQGFPGQALYERRLEGFRFMHCKNINVKNVTIRNMYTTHMLTVEGVDGANITNCVFKDQYLISERKEAVHIDVMHSYDMAPSAQDNVRYDDTQCNNIIVDSCLFNNVPRGVGTHIAIQGIYPDNIVVVNCTFKNIKYEAIKAYCYKNYVLSGNTIDNAGLGIRAYCYTAARAGGEDPYQAPNNGVLKEKHPSSFNGMIENNVITHITNEFGEGILLQGSSGRVYRGVTVRNNSIFDTKQKGISCKHCANIVIEKNSISNSSKGISTESCSKMTLNSNNISKCKTQGIYVKSGKRNMVVGNSISNTGSNGVLVNSVNKLKITNNDIVNANKKSVSVKGSKKVTLKN